MLSAAPLPPLLLAPHLGIIGHETIVHVRPVIVSRLKVNTNKTA